MKSPKICGRVIKTVGRVKGYGSVRLSVYASDSDYYVLPEAVTSSGDTVEVRSFQLNFVDASLDKLIDFLKKVRAEMLKGR